MSWPLSDPPDEERHRLIVRMVTDYILVVAVNEEDRADAISTGEPEAECGCVRGSDLSSDSFVVGGLDQRPLLAVIDRDEIANLEGLADDGTDDALFGAVHVLRKCHVSVPSMCC
ncbi:hypothetical protein MES5069_230022 [Mesorhizobium escarrei]|uniref:Uncharacterized protein n=1 Tax=Mesorhizobium escarrei TaxID=666018 RepID=A0ABN8JNC1_9HYPH|nr:hypothetical protein MES5069_230022 [Mesorhizobium escarrei]